MPIPVICPKCQRKLVADDGAMGTVLPCPKCKCAIKVEMAAIPIGAPIEKEPTKSRLLGHKFVVAGLIGLGIAALMTVGIGGSGTVVNLDLLSTRLNLVLVSCCSIVCGVLYIVQDK